MTLECSCRIGRWGYVFKIEEVSDGFSSLFKEIDDEDGKHLLVLTENTKTFMHFDATKPSNYNQ